LYTDGLVESRDKDIQEGFDWLQASFGPGTPQQPLEDLCKASLREVYEAHQRDDIAVLIARLRRIPADNRLSWCLTPTETSVREAENGRGLHVVSQLAKRWGARRTPSGKVVWCEQVVPTPILEAAGAVPVYAGTTAVTMPDEFEADLEMTGQ